LNITVVDRLEHQQRLLWSTLPRKGIRRISLPWSGSKIVSNNDQGERAPLLAHQEHTGAAADSETMDRATSYLLFVFLFALFFWGWAVKNAV